MGCYISSYRRRYLDFVTIQTTILCVLNFCSQILDGIRKVAIAMFILKRFYLILRFILGFMYSDYLDN